jgi:hypothetical protein
MWPDTLDIVDTISPTPIWCGYWLSGDLDDERGSDMTLEELEFMQQYPRIPAERVPAVLAEVKRQRAIAEEAKRAAQQKVDLR